MDWIASNWIWLALGVGVLALFAFGRGGCGMGHGAHDHRRGKGDQYDRPREMPSDLLSRPAARVDTGDSNSALRLADHVHGTPAAKEAALATDHATHGSAPGQAGPRRHRHGC